MKSDSDFLWHLPGELHLSCPLAELTAALQGMNCGLRQPTAAVNVRPHLLTQRQLRGGLRMPSAPKDRTGAGAKPGLWCGSPVRASRRQAHLGTAVTAEKPRVSPTEQEQLALFLT